MGHVHNIVLTCLFLLELINLKGLVVNLKSVCTGHNNYVVYKFNPMTKDCENGDFRHVTAHSIFLTLTMQSAYCAYWSMRVT
jgi:hypothetical protein